MYPRKIVVEYSTIDRFRQRKTFSSLLGAQRFAQKWVGPHPDVSETFNYAVSEDGIGKIVSNIPVRELFRGRVDALALLYNKE